MTKGQKKYGPAPFRVFEMYEEQIIQMIADGKKQYQIAQTIPRATPEIIESYLRRIKNKWGATNTPNLIHLWHLKQKENDKRKNQSQ